jgi:hypothetical protein
MLWLLGTQSSSTSVESPMILSMRTGVRRFKPTSHLHGQSLPSVVTTRGGLLKSVLFRISLPRNSVYTERSFCSHLYILGWESASSLKEHLETTGSSVALVHRAIAHMGLGRVSYRANVDAPVAAVVLVLGEPAFLKQASEVLSGRPALFLGSSHRTSRRPPPGPARRLLPHRSFGGPTNYVALFGAQGVACKPVKTTIRRSVGHIFDFGMRPNPLESADNKGGVLSMSIDDVLQPARLD